MGAIWFRTREFGGVPSEKAGYKSGLALDEARLRGFLEDGGYSDLWPNEDTLMRVRSEVFEEIFAYVLYRLGIGPPTHDPTVLIAVWHGIKDDPERRALFEPVANAFVEWLKSAVAEDGGPLDPRPLVEDVARSHGPTAALLAVDMVKRAAARVNNSPYSAARSVNWADTRDLDELFRSERSAAPTATTSTSASSTFLQPTSSRSTRSTGGSSRDSPASTSRARDSRSSWAPVGVTEAWTSASGLARSARMARRQRYWSNASGRRRRSRTRS